MYSVCLACVVWCVSTENSPHAMKCRRMKKAEVLLVPAIYLGRIETS
jgi:hypothetical protein